MWVNIAKYLPGNNRMIQIWAKEGECYNGPPGTWVGYHTTGADGHKCFVGVIAPDGVLVGRQVLKGVTHWAEILGEPEDF